MEFIIVSNNHWIHNVIHNTIQQICMWAAAFWARMHKPLTFLNTFNTERITVQISCENIQPWGIKGSKNDPYAHFTLLINHATLSVRVKVTWHAQHKPSSPQQHNSCTMGTCAVSHFVFSGSQIASYRDECSGFHTVDACRVCYRSHQVSTLTVMRHTQLQVTDLNRS